MIARYMIVKKSYVAYKWLLLGCYSHVTDTLFKSRDVSMMIDWMVDPKSWSSIFWHLRLQIVCMSRLLMKPWTFDQCHLELRKQSRLVIARTDIKQYCKYHTNSTVELRAHIKWNFFNSLLGLRTKQMSKLRIIGPLGVESIGDRWIPFTKG